MRDQRDPEMLGTEILRLTRTAGYSATQAADAVLQGNPIKSQGTNGSVPAALPPRSDAPENGVQRHMEGGQ